MKASNKLELTTDQVEAAEIADRMEAENDGASESCYKVLSSIRQTVKARDEWKDKTIETLSNLCIM